MADKTHHTHQKTNWTDGLPHDFKGWGPRTPDPDEAKTDGYAPDDTLVWRDKGEAHHHHVWRFDMRRHHHN